GRDPPQRLAHGPRGCGPHLQRAAGVALRCGDARARHHGGEPFRGGGARVTAGGTVIAFDFGLKRIGVAVGETSTGIASPLGAIREESNDGRFREIGKVVDEWHPSAFVVGRPRHADSSEHATAKLAEKFARRLAARYGLPIIFVDETLSSVAAEQALRAG